MSPLADLPPDQSAVLSLLLRQRKSYAEVANLLHIEERTVRDRAHAALAALAPTQAAGLDPERRRVLGDYLLSQQSPSRGMVTRTQLQVAGPDRAWAQAVAAEISTLSSEPLPEIPAGASAGEPTSAPRAAEPPSSSTPRAVETPSSRRAGALLLAVILVVVVVAVVLITSGGGGKGKTGASHAATSASSTTTATSTAQPHVDTRFEMKPADSSSNALGAAELLSQGKRRAFFLIAQGLPATNGFFYVAWLYNSQSSFKALGRGPTVGSAGTLRAVGALPSNASSFHRLILTRETSTQSTHPGPIVLSGSFSG
jgi:Sigma-70, region 4